MINQAKYQNLRLPSNIVPSKYDITIIPDINKFTITGHETIEVNVRESTNKIILNVSDIHIQSSSYLFNEQELNASNIEVNNSDEIATLTFPNNLPVGFGKLNIKFTSLVASDLKGCYRSKYVTVEGETRHAIATQFASAFCRRAFPCWDEPALKAKFNLTLVAPKDRVALSNMPIIEEKDYEADNSKRIIKFDTSPIMSTYLVAFTIGEYDFVEKLTKNNTQIRVYTPVGKQEQGTFALDIAVRCLEFYEEYFKIKYPLPKLDLIAIAEFALNAMENWGLITYRETAILYDQQNSSTIRKQFIASVVCHELAHQWFGNLVTMSWWNDLWLNEGFASFIVYLAVDYILPEYNIYQTFITNEILVALKLDALNSSHPIEVPVNHPSEIEEIFDAISYRKGASIIRMLYDYIGSKLFQEGMNSYLNKYAYANAVTDQLWESLEEVSQKPVGQIMNTWTKQKGFPVINVVSKQDGSKKILTLTQEKFSNDGNLNDQDKQAKWLIPLTIITENNTKPIKILLENKTQEVIIENVKSNEWIKLNTQFTSYCRINYSLEMLNQFKQCIINKSLSSIDRLNLQSDLFAFTINAKISSDHFFRFIEYYVDENEYPVWLSIIQSLNKFNSLLEYTDYQEVFHLYCRKLLANIFSRVGMKTIPSEDHLTTLLRANVVQLLSDCKDQQVLNESKSLFEAHVSKISLITPDLQTPIFSSIANNCDDKTWDQFLKLYCETDFQEEKNRIIECLATSNNEQQIHKLIEFIFSDQVPNQEAIAYMMLIAEKSKIGRELTWNYFKENHKMFMKRYGQGILIGRLVKCLTENFATEEYYADVISFFTSNPTPSTERSIQQALENIRSNINLLSRDSLIIKNYLTNLSQL